MSIRMIADDFAAHFLFCLRIVMLAIIHKGTNTTCSHFGHAAPRTEAANKTISYFSEIVVVKSRWFYLRTYYVGLISWSLFGHGFTVTGAMVSVYTECRLSIHIDANRKYQA